MSKKHRHGPSGTGAGSDVMAETNGAQVEESGLSLDALDVPVVSASRRVTLEDAVSRVLEELDPDHQRIIQDCAAETGQPPSAYILSALRLSRDRGEMSKLDRDSMVEPEAQGLPATVQCTWCQTWFTPTAKGQYVCPVPVPGQDSCARQQALDRQRKKRDAARQPVDLSEGLPGA